jgi:hypothetical protein
MKKYLLVTLIAVASLLTLSCSRNQRFQEGDRELYDTITVYSVDKIVETSGNKDRIETETYYLVATDKGAYRIDLYGIWGNPQLIGVVKQNKTYIVKTGWFDAPILKEYKRITKLIREL